MWQWIGEWFSYFAAQCQKFLLGQSKTEKALAEIRAILERMEKMEMSHFDSLVAEIEQLKTVQGSCIALLDKLFADLQEHINEPAVLQQIVSDLQAQREALANAVARNTVAEDETQ